MFQISNKEFLPEDLQEECDQLVENMSQKRAGPKECLYFLSKLEDLHFSPYTVHYVLLIFKEQFVSDVEAMEYVQGLLQKLEERGDDADPAQLIDVHGLIADLYRKASKIVEAETQYKKALELVQKHQGHHTVEAIIYARLAHFNYQKGGSELCEEYFNKSLNIINECLQDDTYLLEEKPVERVQILVGLSSLADLRRFQKNFEDMETLLLQALPLAEKHNEVEFSRILSWLVHNSQIQNNTEEMLKYSLKAKDIVQKIKTDPKKFTGTTIRRIIRHYGRIAHSLFRAQNAERSIAFSTEILHLAKKFFGDNHPLVAQEATTLALHCYWNNSANKKYTQYIKIGEDVLENIALDLEDEQFISLYGVEILNAYMNLGDIYDSMSKYEEAEKYYKKGLQLSENVQRDAPMRACKWHEKLGKLYCKTGRKDEAIKHGTSFIEIHEKQPSPQRPAIRSMEKLLRDVKQGRTTSFGPNRNNWRDHAFHERKRKQ